MCSADNNDYKRRWPSVVGALVAALAGPVTASAQEPDRSQYLIVDCELPPQLVRNGLRNTYLRPRPPLKTSGHECALRGGKYIADRDYNTALEVWLDPAIAGDNEARANVGEIFEKGLGRAPDYGQAAYWYRLAAEAGNRRAQINLGHLYEEGLGVERDPVEAVDWYRRATGLEHSVESIAAVEGAGEVVQLEALRGEVASLHAEADSLRAALDNARAQASDLMLERQRELDALLEAARRQREEATLAEQRAESASDVLTDLEALLDARRSQAAELQSLLTVLQQAVAESRSELETNQARLHQQLTELEDTSSRLEGFEQQAQARRDELVGLEAEYARREAAIASTERALAPLQDEIASLTDQVVQRRDEVAKLQAQRTAIAEKVLAGPEIVLIDPPSPITRGVGIVPTAYPLSTSVIVGQVKAPAGIMSLLINGDRADYDERGLFQFAGPPTDTEFPVSISAVDRQGKRAALELILHPPVAAPGTRRPGDAPAPRQGPEWDVGFGRYHALLIGNDRYRHLTPLRTAVSDVEALAAVLKERYGFETRTLTDATEEQVLAALNEYRQRLTSEDNLLLYYAGHGNIDQLNMRGHWLPVDAAQDDTTNWISVDEVTDILHWMSARQVLVIADSCYSATLTRSSEVELPVGYTDRERLQWLRAVVQKKARVAMTSGGLAPVLDGLSGSHSVFARALLDALVENSELIDGRALHEEIEYRVTAAAADQRFEQLPEYAPIRLAGHEGGSFFFVPNL